MVYCGHEGREMGDGYEWRTDSSLPMWDVGGNFTKAIERGAMVWRAVTGDLPPLLLSN